MGFTSTIRCALRAAAVCCILTACTVTHGYAQQQPSTLPNGLTVVVSPRPGVAIVAIDFWVKAGSASELPGEYGAAHYLEHTLFKGTLHKSGQAADYAVELAGGQLNASTGADYAHYYTEVPSEGFDAALNTIAEIIRNPAFPEKEVARERDVILDELSKRGADQAGRICSRKLHLECCWRRFASTGIEFGSAMFRGLEARGPVTTPKANFECSGCTVLKNIVVSWRDARCCHCVLRTKGL